MAKITERGSIGSTKPLMVSLPFHEYAHVVREETAKKKSGVFFRLSPKVHATSFALWSSLFGILSFELVAKIAHSALSTLPCATWKALEFSPLSAWNWAIHAIIVVFSLELTGSFFTLMRQSQSNDDVQETQVYKGFLGAYSLTYVHSMTTTLSHAFIGANTSLAFMLDNWFHAFLRTFIFGTGLSVKLGPWILLPVFAGVNLGIVGYGNWAGRGLATYTIYKHLSSKELPSLFKYMFISFNVVPMALTTALGALIKTEGTSDMAHFLVAGTIAIFSGGMVFSSNQKVHVRETMM